MNKKAIMKWLLCGLVMFLVAIGMHLEGANAEIWKPICYGVIGAIMLVLGMWKDD